MLMRLMYPKRDSSTEIPQHDCVPSSYLYSIPSIFPSTRLVTTNGMVVSYNADVHQILISDPGTGYIPFRLCVATTSSILGLKTISTKHRLFDQATIGSTAEVSKYLRRNKYM